MDRTDVTGARTHPHREGEPAKVDLDERYRFEQLLGEGGMGKVLLCGDEVIGRRVAVKVIKTEGTGDEERADARLRFLREARIQGQLEHPAIVPVYDLGTDANGAAFFTMKRVRGVTLADIIAKQRAGDREAIDKYTPRRLLAAFGSVCLCIDFAHQHGVVHRDLKPSNIMLGDFGEVYVLDWGIARVVAEPEPDRVSALVLGATPPQDTRSLIGTVGYMPPEQLQESPSDARSDVYALGAILFELLTHERLHDGTTFDAIAASTLAGADARPSVRAPQLAIAAELEDVCVRATALEPAHRFQSARALHEAIERQLDREQSVVIRKEAALEHMVAASGHMTSLAGDSTRKKVLREVGQAVALDPQNPDALRAVARLLATPPPQTPKEVAAQIERIDRNRRRYMARAAAIAYAVFFLYAPAMIAMGVRDWPIFIACQVAALATTVWTYLVGRFGEVTWPITYVGLALTSITYALCSVFFGPLVMVPGPVIANTIGFALIYPDRRRRAIAIAAGIAAMAVPLTLQFAGAIKPSYTFTSAGMLIHPATLDFPPVLAPIFLFLSNVAPIVVGAIAVGMMRDALAKAEVRVHTQAWQLRQLVPADQARPER